MILRTVGGQLQLGGAFKLVAVGYLIGMGVIFVPFFLLIGLFMVLASTTGSGDTGSVGLVLLLQVVMLPVILAMQAVMMGGAVVLGLWLYRMRRPIRVLPEEGPGAPVA